MIEEKDVSPPCGKRHSSKNISNVNLSTQKKTGGKCIMGNQGMTNWKFSAFLAITLMLAAGLFASTAVALDGDGSVAVEWDDELNTADPSEADDNPLDAVSTENTIQFTYTVPAVDGTDDDDMSSGAFRLVVPRGWTVTKKWITILDQGNTPETIYDTNADGKVDTEDDSGDAAADTADSRKRVTILPSSGDNVSSVEVSLDATWINGGVLTIRFGNVSAPTPSRLPFQYTGGAYYEEYQFPSRSKKKDGTLTRLKVTDDQSATTTVCQSWQRRSWYRCSCRYTRNRISRVSPVSISELSIPLPVRFTTVLFE